MAYDPINKRIYIDTSTTPHTGVSVDDVCDGLGLVGVGDIGTLCKSSSINPMAKYKPVEYSSIGVTGKTSGSGYWRGDNGQCGLTIPKDGYGNLLGFMSGATAWSHEQPSTWYRLLDFDGYDASGAVTLDASKIPTGHLTEDNLSTISFENGVAVFHVALNAQDGSGFFLTLNDLGVRFGSNLVAIKNLVPRLCLKSLDGTVYRELRSGEWKQKTEHGSDPEEAEEKTLAEIISSGVSQITFSSIYEFEIEPQLGVGLTVNGADVYTDSNNNQFVVTGAEYSGSRESLIKVRGFRKSGAGTVPSSGTLTKGSTVIPYYNVVTDFINTGSKQFYVFPFLTNEEYACGIGQNAHLMTIVSVTNYLSFSVDNVVWSQSGTTVTYTATCSFMNGFNEVKYVDVLLDTDGAGTWRELEMDLSNPGVVRSNVQLPALQTTTVTISGTVSKNTYTGVAVGYRNPGASGFQESQEYMYDEYGNLVDPDSQ